MRPQVFETTVSPEEVNVVAEAYCVKCKAKKEMAKAQEVTMKNGRPAMQGVCPDCGTKLFRIMGGKK
jgi:Zn finger protein HypA/HybF involved in hydrogenase expression